MSLLRICSQIFCWKANINRINIAQKIKLMKTFSSPVIAMIPWKWCLKFRTYLENKQEEEKFYQDIGLGRWEKRQFIWPMRGGVTKTWREWRAASCLLPTVCLCPAVTRCCRLPAPALSKPRGEYSDTENDEMQGYKVVTIVEQKPLCDHQL